MNKLKEKTMNMKNWAIVGASKNKNKYGYKIVKILLENNYNVYPINPKYEKIADIRFYDNLFEIQEKIDVVDFVINPDIGINVIKELAKLNVKYVWLQPGSRSKEIKSFAKANNIKIIEDCIYASLQ